ncbi:hypothetical protein [Duganella violaceipulchra]|uniref:Lipoprotein n=1 Tax=Duganella violaceipulchra TaxID=2849652 RepID=A0AA41HHJ9_9BURK|nr:hypothetical protein [Duganella violaceicalia]MBV6323903.1 hypothetical protein [Duganella violaceicalia]MCP2011118.1 hypothetical protein [Duganella violaceicalia]
MNKFLTAAMLASLVGLTACATTEQPIVQADASAPAAKPSQARPLTGTRIPSKGTGQTVSATEGSDYDRDSRGQASPYTIK